MRKACSAYWATMIVLYFCSDTWYTYLFMCLIALDLKIFPVFSQKCFNIWPFFRHRLLARKLQEWSFLIILCIVEKGPMTQGSVSKAVFIPWQVTFKVTYPQQLWEQCCLNPSPEKTCAQFPRFRLFWLFLSSDS